MEFRDKNGNVYNNIVKAKLVYCMGRECEECVFGEQPSCTLSTLDNPVEAARLMGYELVEEISCETCKYDPDNYNCKGCWGCDQYSHWEKKEAAIDKPLADWTLGEVKEHCARLRQACGVCIMSKIDSRCRLWNDTEVSPESWDLTDKPRFTDKEMEVFKVFYKNGIKAIRRNEHGGLIFDGSIDMFPLLERGETVRLKDILGEQAKGGA